MNMISIFGIVILIIIICVFIFGVGHLIIDHFFDKKD